LVASSQYRPKSKTSDCGNRKDRQSKWIKTLLQRPLGMHMWSVRLAAKNTPMICPSSSVLPVLTLSTRFEHRLNSRGDALDSVIPGLKPFNEQRRKSRTHGSEPSFGSNVRSSTHARRSHWPSLSRLSRIAPARTSAGADTTRPIGRTKPSHSRCA
jgi:hypothetical protein